MSWPFVFLCKYQLCCQIDRMIIKKIVTLVNSQAHSNLLTNFICAGPADCATNFKFRSEALPIPQLKTSKVGQAPQMFEPGTRLHVRSCPSVSSFRF